MKSIPFRVSKLCDSAHDLDFMFDYLEDLGHPCAIIIDRNHGHATVWRIGVEASVTSDVERIDGDIFKEANGFAIRAGMC